MTLISCLTFSTAYALICLRSQVIKDESLVGWFLAHGADPNAPAGVWDVTPLSYAVLRAPLSTVKLLFENGGSVDKGQLLNYASGRTDSESVQVLQYLLDQGAPGMSYTLWEDRPDLASWARVGDADTPLHHAAETRNVEVVKFLLDPGADRTRRSVTLNRTLFDRAVACKHEEVAKLLEEQIVSPKSRSSFWTALGWR